MDSCLNSKMKLKTQSKFLSLVLRHAPETIGIELDEQGWVDVSTLLEASQANGKDIDFDRLKHIVATSDKQRFAFNEDQTRIRANQGHSVKVKLDLDPVEPPEFLYHGTSTRHIAAIRKEGIRKMNRHHVHLSPDKETAAKVGQRHGRLVILVVRAGEMHRQGFEFFCTENGVWLTDSVPPVYFSD